MTTASRRTDVRKTTKGLLFVALLATLSWLLLFVESGWAFVALLGISYGYVALSLWLVPVSPNERKRQWNMNPLRLLAVWGIARVGLTLAGYYE